MRNKLDNIQALRAFAVLLVVALHVLAIEIKYARHDVLLDFLDGFLRIGISGVDLFFVISGFIMVLVTQHDSNHEILHDTTPRSFLFFRVSRIYPLYWLVTLSILVVYLIQPGLISLPHFSPEFTLKSFLLLPQQHLPILMVGWSLIHELYFYLVFALFLCLPRKLLPSLLGIWFLAVAMGHYTMQAYGGPINPWLRLVFSPVTIEFICGCFLAILMIRHQGQYGLAKTALILGLISFFAIWGVYYYSVASIDIEGWTRVYLFTPPFLMMIYGAVALEYNTQTRAPTWFIRIGDHSYSIYLTHILVLSTLGHIWELFALPGVLDNLVMITLMLAAVIIGGKICFHRIERPLLRLTHRLAARFAGEAPGNT
jgi:peptidoglycan/LPS O-acetylase OafA/YrhL